MSSRIFRVIWNRTGEEFEAWPAAGGNIGFCKVGQDQNWRSLPEDRFWELFRRPGEEQPLPVQHPDAAELRELCHRPQADTTAAKPMEQLSMF